MNITEALMAKTVFRSDNEMLAAAKHAPTLVQRIIGEMFTKLMDAQHAEKSVQSYMNNLERTLTREQAGFRQGMRVDATFLVGHAKRVEEASEKLNDAATEFVKYNAWLNEELPNLDFDTIVAMGIEEHGMVREVTGK